MHTPKCHQPPPTQIDQGNLRLARANGDVLYSIPLERVAGLAHPAPNVLKIKVDFTSPVMQNLVD